MFNETVQQMQGLGISFATVVFFFGILWWVLCIVLFFKVWAMTNDVNKIKDMLKEWLDIEHPVDDTDEIKPKDQE